MWRLSQWEGKGMSYYVILYINIHTYIYNYYYYYDYYYYLLLLLFIIIIYYIILYIYTVYIKKSRGYSSWEYSNVSLEDANDRPWLDLSDMFDLRNIRLAGRPELQIWYGMCCKFYRSLTQFQDLDTQKRWRHQDLLCRLLDDFLGTFYTVSPASKLLSSRISRLVTGSLRKYGVDVGKKKKGAKEDCSANPRHF